MLSQVVSHHLVDPYEDAVQYGSHLVCFKTFKKIHIQAAPASITSKHFTAVEVEISVQWGFAVAIDRRKTDRDHGDGKGHFNGEPLSSMAHYVSFGAPSMIRRVRV